MEIGLVGLGKMGGNMRERLRRAGHTVLGYSRTPAVSDVASLDELVAKLPQPRVIWVMIPAGEPTRQMISLLGDMLSEGDLVVDGAIRSSPRVSTATYTRAGWAPATSRRWFTTASSTA